MGGAWVTVTENGSACAGSLPDRKTALFEQRGRIGIASKEAPVGIRAIGGVAFRQNVLPVSLREHLVPLARLEKRLPRIRRHHVGPDVAVVPGRVPVAAEQVIELRQPMTERDLSRHADALQRLAFETI